MKTKTWAGWTAADGCWHVFLNISHKNKWRTVSDVCGWEEVEALDYADHCAMREQTWAMWQGLLNVSIKRKQNHLTADWLDNLKWNHPCEVVVLKEGKSANIESYWDIGEQTWAIWQGLA